LTEVQRGIVSFTNSLGKIKNTGPEEAYTLLFEKVRSEKHCRFEKFRPTDIVRREKEPF
jgi:hypothetical protein